MADQDGQPILQVPLHEFRVVDDGSKETVEISVSLPGVSTASEISVRIEPPHTVTVTVPRSYQLVLTLAVPIAARAEKVTFRSKAARLLMTCRVLTAQERAAAVAEAAAAANGIASPSAAAAAAADNGFASLAAAAPVPNAAAVSSSSRSNGNAAAGASPGRPAAGANLRRSDGSTAAAAAPPAAGSSGGGSSSSSSSNGQAASQRVPPKVYDPKAAAAAAAAAAEAAAAKAHVHESFFPQPTKAERKRMQQEEERRRQEEAAAAAAAAAAAEARRQAEAAAAAKRAAVEAKREEARRKAQAAAAARAAAAEEKQRREQQRRLNKAAAEDWLTRGHTAVAQGDMQTAAKAVAKATELDPTNKAGVQKLTKELNALRQQTAAAAEASRRAAAAGASSSSSSGAAPQPPPSQQQQQQQQQYQPQQKRETWGERRQRRGHGVSNSSFKEMLDKWSSGEHDGSIVGRWCSLLEFVFYWLTWLGAVASEWALAARGSPKHKGAVMQLLVTGVEVLGAVIMFIPPLCMVLWQLAWHKPLGVIAYVRRVGGDSHLEAAEWRYSTATWLESEQHLTAAISKLLLAGSSGSSVAAVLYGTCWMPVGAHSLLGWVGSLLGWLWRALLWRPEYALQVVVASIGTAVCSTQRVGFCSLTLYPLQVMISGGRWKTLLSLLISFLHNTIWQDWRPSWREFKAPWWQSAFAQTAFVMVARTISRMGISWLFLAPLQLLQRLSASVLIAALDARWSPVRWLFFVIWLYMKVVEVLEWVAAVCTTGPLSFVAGPGSVPALLLGPVLGPVVGWLTNAFTWGSNLILPVTALKLQAGLFCVHKDNTFMQGICNTLDHFAEAKAAAQAAAADAPTVFPHSWWFDLMLVIWLFYVISVITKWEELYGKAYYRQQREREQREQQQQQRRGHAGSEDEADHGSLGDKTSDFPMGFGPVSVPDGCEVATVKAVLEAADYYKVMGFDSREEVTAETLKLKRRQLVLAVHPDKVGHDYPGANQAAGRVNKAFETLSDASMRHAYDSILANHSRGRGGRAGGSGGAAEQEKYSDDLYDRPPAEDKFMCQDMACPGCGRHHTAYILPKAPFGVRWCAECEDWHPTSKGEVWAHWTPGPLGFSFMGDVRLMLSPDPEGPVYDVTEVFRCKGMGGGVIPRDKAMCNRHTNHFMTASAGRGGFRPGGGGGGGGGTSTARRSRKKKGRR